MTEENKRKKQYIKKMRIKENKREHAKINGKKSARNNTRWMRSRMLMQRPYTPGGSGFVFVYVC